MPETSTDLATGVRWRDWNAAAFAAAAALNRPVLLSVVARWSLGCDEMDATVFGDAALASVINDRSIAVRVDADRRPDINDRYNLGGWPTTAILNPQAELLGGGTFVTADRLRTALLRAADLLASGRSPVAQRLVGAVREPPLRSPATVDTRDVIAFCRDQILSTFDPDHGGFGGAPKFHHPDALILALELYRREGDERMLDIVVRTLDAMAAGELWDAGAGGFYRCAVAADWTPQHEKTLESNVRLARVFLDAWHLTGNARLRDRLVTIVQYVHNTLMDPVDGGFYACHADRTLFADLNGLASDLFARAAVALEDESLLDLAGRATDRILQPTYEPGGGIAHYVVGHDAFVRGLLGDHVHMSGALLSMCEASGRPVYRDLAAELMHYAVRTMWDQQAGGFRDRLAAADDIGLLRDPLRPFALNCEAAFVLARLGEAGVAELGQRARATLESFASEWAAHGLDACAYARAWLELGQP